MKTRPIISSVVIFALGVGLGAAGVWVWMPTSTSTPSMSARVGKRATQPADASSSNRRILYWADPMNPAIHADHSMKDNMGMAYIPVYAHAAARSQAGLKIDSRMTQSLGVRLVAVERRQMGRGIQTVGSVAVDENRLYAVNPRFSGWVTHLAVRAIGDPVTAGRVLAEIYSPELYGAEQEYLIALRSHAQDSTNALDRELLRAATSRLHLLGLSDGGVHALAIRGAAQKYVTVVAPTSGVVERLSLRQGGHVTPHNNLMEIANLNRVWVMIALYGNQMSWVRLGDHVDLRSPDYPGTVWKGHLDFLYPTVGLQSRTVTARVSIPNPGGILRPGMYVDAHVLSQGSLQLAVPTSAVLHTERGDFVILGQAEGHFLPVQVRVGPETDGWTAIRQGLRAGEQVVDNAQFLLYSESQFQSVQARMLGGTRDATPPGSPKPLQQPKQSATHRPVVTPQTASMAGMHLGSRGHD